MKEIKRLTRCEKGHFYDGGKYGECPHCNNSKIPEETVLIPKEESENLLKKENEQKIDKKENSEKKEASRAKSEPEKAKAQTFAETERNENFTVHYFGKTIGTDPVVGWLVCVKGAHFGEDFRIKSGRNFIGRSGSMDISLCSDISVSREKHAILTYDPKGNEFIIQPGESTELCYLNEKIILVPMELKPYDTICLGETELMFVPFCGQKFNWNKIENR